MLDLDSLAKKQLNHQKSFLDHQSSGRKLPRLLAKLALDFLAKKRLDHQGFLFRSPGRKLPFLLLLLALYSLVEKRLDQHFEDLLSAPRSPLSEQLCFADFKHLKFELQLRSQIYLKRLPP